MPVITDSDALLLDVAMKEDVGEHLDNNNSRHKRSNFTTNTTTNTQLFNRGTKNVNSYSGHQTSSTRSLTSDLTASDHEGDDHSRSSNDKHDNDDDCCSEISTASISSLSNLFAEIEHKVSTSAGLTNVARGGSSSVLNHNDRDKLKREVLKLQIENRELKKGYEQMRALCVELMEDNTRLKRKASLQQDMDDDGDADADKTRTSESLFDPTMRIGEITIPKSDAATKYLGNDATTTTTGGMKRSTSVPIHVGYHNILRNYKSIVNNNNKDEKKEKNIDEEQRQQEKKTTKDNKRRIGKNDETCKTNDESENNSNKNNEQQQQSQEEKNQATTTTTTTESEGTPQQPLKMKVYHTMRRASFISECSSNFTDLHLTDSVRTVPASDYVSADGETIPINSDNGDDITTDDDQSNHKHNNRGGVIGMSWWNRTRRISNEPSSSVQAHENQPTDNSEPGLEGTDSSSVIVNQDDDHEEEDDIEYEVEAGDDDSDVDANKLKNRLLSLICDDDDDDMPEVLDVGRHQHCARILQSQIYQEASFGYL